jgi:hypothetical protein
MDTTTTIVKYNKKIKLSTYACSIEIIVTSNIIDEVNKIYKKHKFDEIFADVVEGVVVTIDLDKYYIVLSTKYLTHNTIAHEVYHAAVRITEDRSISDEEAQAWLAGHLTEEVYKFIEKKKLNITHGG